MEPRLNAYDNPLIMKFVKHINSASAFVSNSDVPVATQELVKLRASQINGCGFCTDMHSKDAAQNGETSIRLNLVAAWRDATVFTEAERAALELTEQGTRIADAAGGVTDEAWENAVKHYDQDQLAALVALIALINTYNRMNLITRQPAGNYQPAQFARADFMTVSETLQNGRVSPDIDELRRLRRARDQMDREYARPLDVPALARTALMSTAHFSRRFREAYAESPYSYLMTRRIERAMALLRRGDLSVTDVCFAVGWNSLGSFSARFTELVGETPSTYRARNHDELRVIPTCLTMVLTRPRKRGGQAAEESSFREAPALTPA